MTAEMGDHDATPTLRQRFAGISVAGAVALMNYVSDDAYGRYDRDTARLSLYGESENAGDAYERGRAVSSMTTVAVFGPMLPALALAVLADVMITAGGETAALLPWLLGLSVTSYAVTNAFGMIGLTQKIGVVDHTTEPTPDALDDLQRQYVDGEIDEQELDERAAEVWER